MAEKRLDIVLRARDEVARGLNSAMGRLNAAAGKFKANAQGSTDALAKVFAYMSTIEGAARGVEAVSSVIQGDLEGAAEAVKRLPLGVGAAATALEDMLATVTGIKAEMKELAEFQKWQAEQEKKLNETLKTQAQWRERIDDLAAKATLSALSGNDRKRAEARRERDELIAEIEEFARNTQGVSLTGELVTDAKLAAERQYQAALAEIDREYAEKRQRDAEQAAKEDARLREQQVREAQREADQRARMESERASLAAQVRASALRALDRDLEAELVLMEDSYRRRMALVADAETRMLLEKQRAFDVARLLEQGQAGPAGRGRAQRRTVSGGAITNDYHGLREMYLGTGSHAKDAQEKTNDKLDELRKQNEKHLRLAGDTLDEIRAGNRQGGGHKLASGR